MEEIEVGEAEVDEVALEEGLVTEVAEVEIVEDLGVAAVVVVEGLETEVEEVVDVVLEIEEEGAVEEVKLA